MPSATEAPSTVDSLERRYRRLLVAYPSAYRHRRADEIVGTFLDLAAPGQTRPRLADAADLLSGGVRQRLGLDTDADLNAGAALAGPVALALAAGLSAFLWWSVEPLFGSPLSPAAPAAYAAWLLALAGWVALPARYARWPVALAMAVTALVLPVTLTTGEPRPPLWVVLALLAFGALTLAAPAPRGATVRLAVTTGALVTAALAKWLLAGQLPATRWATGYYQPVLSLAGLVVAVAVVGVAAGAVLAAVEGRRARPWLWAALLLALPGGWLGPRSTAVEPGFGRLAEVMLATCVVVAAMTGVRGSTRPAVPVHRAGRVALGCAAGLAAYFWLGAGPGNGSWGYAGWLVAVLVAPLLPVLGQRIVVGLAMGLTLVVGSAPGGALFTLVLLGIVALLVPARGVPLPAAFGTFLAAAVVTSYDNGWRLTPTVPFAHTANLVLTLAIVPFTVAALAGVTVVRGRAHRVRGVALLLAGTGWVGALTVPHLAAWGPILVLVPLAGTGLGVLLLVRAALRRRR